MATSSVDCADEGELISDDECEDEESDDEQEPYVTPSTSPNPGTSLVSIISFD
jgi:hypothetical protein